MIACPKKLSQKQSVPAWHPQFLAMLPAIRRQALISFRHLDAQAREEAVQEVVASAVLAFRRLVDLGKTSIAFPSVLARYGVAQFRAGRRVGASLNCQDVSSLHCQNQKRLTLERLDFYDWKNMCWQEVLLESRVAGPAETAASRIDFAAWLRSLSGRQRRIATTLAAGEATSTVARKFRLTAGRISQLRRELQQGWELFVGERPLADRNPCRG